MTFTEANTVEKMILDAVTKLGGRSVSRAREDLPRYGGESLGGELRPACWSYVPSTEVPCKPGDVMVEPWLREALVHLNPEIADQPDPADGTTYNLQPSIPPL